MVYPGLSGASADPPSDQPTRTPAGFPSQGAAPRAPGEYQLDRQTTTKLQPQPLPQGWLMPASSPPSPGPQLTPPSPALGSPFSSLHITSQVRPGWEIFPERLLPFSLSASPQIQAHSRTSPPHHSPVSGSGGFHAALPPSGWAVPCLGLADSPGRCLAAAGGLPGSLEQHLFPRHSPHFQGQKPLGIKCPQKAPPPSLPITTLLKDIM